MLAPIETDELVATCMGNHLCKACRKCSRCRYCHKLGDYSGVCQDQSRSDEAPALVRLFNVPGNRESSDPGIGNRVERFMLGMLRKLIEA